MSDFSFTIQPFKNTADIEIEAGDFKTGNDLETAVLVSLFSNRRATDDELNTFARGNSKPELNEGLWIDTYRTDIQYGSGFWLLYRENKKQETLSRFEDYARQSLQWLIDDGVALSVDSDAVFDGERLILAVTITRQNDAQLLATFDFAWNELRLDIGFTRG
jgi:phage gp46-like protein